LSGISMPSTFRIAWFARCRIGYKAERNKLRSENWPMRRETEADGLDKISLKNEQEFMLFKMSSVIPDTLYARAVSEGLPLQPQARGMVFNADMITFLKFLEFGTKVAKNLR